MIYIEGKIVKIKGMDVTLSVDFIKAACSCAATEGVEQTIHLADQGQKNSISLPGIEHKIIRVAVVCGNKVREIAVNGDAGYGSLDPRRERNGDSCGCSRPTAFALEAM